ncbi:hypothetical protein D3C73_1200380 [compost metagenome]
MPDIDPVKLLYVGMTRASKKLDVGLSENNIFRSIIESDNLKDIKKNFNLSENYEYIIHFTIQNITSEEDEEDDEYEESRLTEVIILSGSGIESIICELNEKYWFPLDHRKDLYRVISNMYLGEVMKVIGKDRLIRVELLKSPFPNNTRDQFIESFLR